MNTQNPLETQPIGKLMIRFSLPCIISMLVNSLYNVVDQIFIGWGVGYLGNGATNIVFPFTLVAMAIALMFGDGAAAFMSIELGEKNDSEVKLGIGNTITVTTVLGITMKVNQILSSILVGISVGAQPIIGYNYGAKKGRRVRQTLKVALITASAVSLAAFLLFQFTPMLFVFVFFCFFVSLLPFTPYAVSFYRQSAGRFSLHFCHLQDRLYSLFRWFWFFPNFLESSAFFGQDLLRMVSHSYLPVS